MATTIEAGKLLRADTLILDGVAVDVVSARRAECSGSSYVLIEYTVPGSYVIRRHFERFYDYVDVDEEGK